ncbi:MAG: YfhO family protein [Chitinophagaceae bacterium]|nr:YfhO family protein [Chitinophagaceae bacterium]
MKQINFKQALPHLVAVVVFLLLSVMLNKPALQGKVVQQSDVIQWKAMAQQSFEYKEKYGHFPKWTNSMMGGMPAYQIALGPKTPVHFHLEHVQKILTLGFPKPVFYLFIAALCFYLLCIVIGVNPWISILGGIAYAYCSYNPVLIAGGHDTKMLSMAYAPAVLAGLQLIFKQKYWIGSAVLLTSGILLLSQHHQQIVYYTLLMVVFMTVPFIIKSIREKAVKHLLLSGLISIGIGAVILSTMAMTYWPTYEFSKETMRGGRSELTQKETKNATKGGLDKDYAFMWSYGKAETMTLLVPNAFGGSSAEGLGENSKAIEVLQENAQTLPEGFPQQIAQSSPMYWGELLSTQGTVYLGAMICLLFLFGAFLSKSEHRWWLVALTVFGIVLAWGKNFEAVNYFLFDHMPFYKKFRAPSMSLVIPQLTVPLLAVIFLQEFLFKTDKEKLQQLIKKCLYITGGIAAVLGIFYFMADFTNGATADLRKNINDALQGKGTEFNRSYFNALKSDRQAFYLSDMWRSLGFMFVTIATLYLFAKNKIKPAVVYSVLIIFCIIDLFGVSKRYLKEENFVEADELESSYVDTRADLQLKTDTGYYRVLNLVVAGQNGYQVDVSNSFNNALASYKHNTIGGYSPAKLGLYQDLIERQIYKNIQGWGTNPMAKDSFPVLNMLNMKYAIVPDQRDPKQTQAVLNPFALGNCWLVKEVKFVKNADEEMNALDSFDPSAVAFVDERFKAAIPFTPVFDSSASIRLIENKNDEIKYEFNAATSQFAVFSEIYYPHGWEAYIDGKKSPYVKTNYALRGLAIPAGKHTIDFVFDPASVRIGENISRYLHLFSVVFVLLCLFMAWKYRNKTTGNLKAE